MSLFLVDFSSGYATVVGPTHSSWLRIAKYSTVLYFWTWNLDVPCEVSMSLNVSSSQFTVMKSYKRLQEWHSSADDVVPQPIVLTHNVKDARFSVMLAGVLFGNLRRQRLILSLHQRTAAHQHLFLTCRLRIILFFVLPQLHLLSFRAPCLTVNAASEQWHLVAWRRTKNLYCYECLHQYALCRNSVLWPNNLFGVSLSRPCYAGFEEKSSNRYPHWIHSSCYPVEFSYFLSSTRGWRGWCSRMFCIEKIAGGHP